MLLFRLLHQDVGTNLRQVLDHKPMDELRKRRSYAQENREYGVVIALNRTEAKEYLFVWF